jgi:hypothetical protein
VLLLCTGLYVRHHARAELVCLREVHAEGAAARQQLVCDAQHLHIAKTAHPQRHPVLNYDCNSAGLLHAGI